MPEIKQLTLFPRKGLQGVTSHSLDVDKDVGIVGDRNIAYPRKPLKELKHEPKGKFYVCMSQPRMAALSSWISQDELKDALHLDERPEILQTNGAFNMTDTAGASVSLINRGTVRLFREFLARELGPQFLELESEETTIRRFRMNVEMDDAPFWELSLTNGFPGDVVIQIGELLYRVDDACERCLATHANPETGLADLLTTDLLEVFMAKYLPDYLSPHRQKRQVMGILLVPLSSGRITVGDNVRLLG